MYMQKWEAWDAHCNNRVQTSAALKFIAYDHGHLLSAEVSVLGIQTGLEHIQTYPMWTGTYANVDCLEYISKINSRSMMFILSPACKLSL